MGDALASEKKFMVQNCHYSILLEIWATCDVIIM